jgi:hypothetical protein
MEDRTASAQTPPHDTIDSRIRRLTEAAAGAVDQPTRTAFAAIARACEPDTIDTLLMLLRRMRMVAPDRVAARPVVAFIRYGRAEGVPPVRGVAVTVNEPGRYNVHSVFWDERTARWEAQNGRYGVPWTVAHDELIRRADADVRP